MTAHALLTGRLIADPIRRETKTGKPMCSATLAVDVPDPRDATSDPDMLFGLVAFGSPAEALGTHAKGDTVAISGVLQRNRWTAEDGMVRERLNLVVDGVLSAKASREARRGSSRDKPGSRSRFAPAPAQPFPDDPIGF
jgi:single-stranded DNA-binding protein